MASIKFDVCLIPSFFFTELLFNILEDPLTWFLDPIIQISGSRVSPLDDGVTNHIQIQNSEWKTG